MYAIFTGQPPADALERVFGEFALAPAWPAEPDDLAPRRRRN